MKSLSKEELPPGYTESRDRSCVFCLDFASQASGERGLAMAVMLQAIRDGCNSEWLKEIAEWYHIPVPEELLENIPAKRIKIFPNSEDFSRIECDGRKKKLVLSWRDGLARK